MPYRRIVASKMPRAVLTVAGAILLLWTLHVYHDNGPLVRTSENLLNYEGGDLTRTAFTDRSFSPNEHNFVKPCQRRSSPEGTTSAHSLLAYTAHYDETADAIDVLSAAKIQPYSKAYYCHIWDEDDQSSERVITAKLDSVLSATQNNYYSLLSIYKCHYPSHMIRRKTRLAINDEAYCHSPTDKGLHVHSKRPAIDQQLTVRFAVCCLPEWDTNALNIDLFITHFRPENLIAFFEANSMMGAERFYYYNMTANRGLDDVLAYYEAKGLVTIIQWPKILDLFSLKAARQDCLHRSQSEVQFLIYLSLNDILMPASEQAWKGIVNHTLPSQPAAYRLTSVLFGVPSKSPCKVQNSSLLRVAARVNAMQYTLFGGFSTTGADKRFHRMMYNVAAIRSHPSIKEDDWLESRGQDSTPEGQQIVHVDASLVRVNNYDSKSIVSMTDRSLRLHPLKYSSSLCQYSDVILTRILESCAAC